MKERDAHYRHILLRYFLKVERIAITKKVKCHIREKTLKKSQNWFVKFRSSDFSLKNAQRSGRPVEVDETLPLSIQIVIDIIHIVITTHEIPKKLNASQT
ncbi:hypothetical protein CDAR_290301 [Caerostris darwini]|uniref:Transposase n=1 Tax=Caerostris darwini TaxID=1538125 RepID=A0AAV4TBE8_9ARAC|nr:hypothetical protein CDAR_290301 [Caerostris darwini]